MNKNIYIFAGENYMVRESVKALKASLDIQLPEINITEFKTMPKADELIEACCAVPFMSEKRLVIVGDCALLTSKGGGKKSADNEDETKEDETKKDDKGSKKFVDAISRFPETTVLVMTTDGVLDKRKALYNMANKQGSVKEFAAPGQSECVSFAQLRAKQHGVSISSKAALNLIAAAGCDYYTIDNEIAKLSVYSTSGEITPSDVAQCVSKSLEYNVFEIHSFLINKQAEKAERLLDDILRTERPEGLIGLIARKIRDMYKVKTMSDIKAPITVISEKTGIKSFVVEIIKKECARFTQQDLREALQELADLDYSIKSGEADAYTSITKTLLSVYKL